MPDRAKPALRTQRRPRPAPATVVGHEIRGSIGVVVTLSEMLLERELGDSERELVALLRLAGNHALGIAEDLCTEAALAGNHLRLSPTRFDPAGTIEALAALWAPIAAGANRRVEAVIEDGLPTEIFSDEGRIRQVLFNLVSNASRHAEGTITLSVRRMRGRLRYEVADRGRSGASAGSEGLGIGLWISRRIADALGGRLTLADRPGGGTIARLTIPLALPSARPLGRARRRRKDEAPRGPVPPALARPPLQVLFVDDSAVSQMLMTAMLTSFGMSVTTVASGVEAAEAARARRPDLIVSDWQLADETGADAIARIGSVLGPTLPPVVLVSAEADLPSVPGVRAFVAKPFTPRELLAAIEGALAAAAVASTG